MELHYVKIEEDWDDLKNGSSVTFDLPTKEIYYKIYNPSGSRWWLINDGFNGRIFDELRINGSSFVESVVGYPCGGDFPEVESLDDLKKVIKALDDECVKKFGIPDDTDGTIAINKHAMLDAGLHTEKTQEEPKEELNLFPTKKHYQLNFNY